MNLHKTTLYYNDYTRTTNTQPKQRIEARFYDDFITNLRLLYGRQEIELEIITGVDLPF